MSAPFRSTPIPTDRMPPGVPYIVANEAAERFSFYGMKTILFVFMTEYLVSRSGQLAVMSEAEATYYYHLFVSAVYFFPIVGAIISDAFWGKYRTILWLSIVYVFGHLALAVDETRLGLAVGLSLIAIGSGGIKPCVSAHVGDQFGERNRGLLERVYAWFYFSINFGSFFSTLLTPVLLVWFGPSVAFGVPGVLMFLATLIFWAGRYQYAHVPPAGIGFVKQAFRGEGLRALGNLLLVYVFIAVFWSLYEQTGSRWIEQAKAMDRDFSLEGLRALGLTFLPAQIEVLPSQIQAVNPVLVMLFIPLFSYVVYPSIGRVFRLSPLRKISIGLFLMVGAFAISALIERWIVAGLEPSIGWQMLAYFLLTASEVMVYATGLEFSYTQAPTYMKSFVMSLYLLTVTAGNLFTALVNKFIQRPDGTTVLEGPAYYWFFCGLMLAASLLFIPVSQFYRGKTYLQTEGGEAERQ